MSIGDLEAVWDVVTPLRFDWIQVEVSAICNASCAYCVLTCYKDQWGGDLMDMQTFESLKPSFALTDLVFLQGWGEPLLHPQFWDMVREVKSAGAKVGFTTNGMPLTDKHLNSLLEEQVDIMGVSLAGTTAATHERFREGCDFERIHNALQKLKQMKQERQVTGPILHLAFMLLKSNWQELPQLPALASEWGINQIVVNNLSFIGNAAMQEESLLLQPELWPEVSAALESAKKEAERQGINLHYYRPHLEEQCAICTENVLKACFISYRGDVSPCVMTNISLKPGETAEFIFQNTVYPVENYLFGNISEESLPAIWKGVKAQEFRTAFEQRLTMEHPGTHQLPAPCRRCYKLMEQ
ncbi:MAG: radical SAM/SPASM domain-containing protein [Gammaproteobacteria bacterium]